VAKTVITCGLLWIAAKWMHCKFFWKKQHKQSIVLLVKNKGQLIRS